MLRGYDEWKLRAGNSETPRTISAHCSYCHDEIYDGDDAHVFEELTACSVHCVVELAHKNEIDVERFELTEI